MSKRASASAVRTPEQRQADDAALIATGEPLALLHELARSLGVSGNVLHRLVLKKGGPLVRYLSTPRPVRFCVADVTAVVEGARAEIDAHRARADAKEAKQRADAEARRAAKAAAPKAKTPKLKGAAPKPSTSTPTTKGPEVVTMRRRAP